MTAASAIYTGRVTHARRGPTPHRFGFRLYMLYLDLDEIAQWPPSVLLRRGRAGILSFFRGDYYGDASTPLKTSVLDRVEECLGARPDGPVRLLTQVRCFGFVFNPVSFYYCFAADGATLEAVVAEITNTPWQERHTYVLAAKDGDVRASFPKAFHVSPFFAMTQRYRWRMTSPGDTLAVTMVNEEDGEDVFSATLALERRDLTAGALWRVVLRQPFMTWLIQFGIYFQAFRLWRKRTPYFEHPATRAASGIRREDTWKA